LSCVLFARLCPVFCLLASIYYLREIQCLRCDSIPDPLTL
jgi:hypothetical protein